MESELMHRPQWPIDRLLASLVGAEVRVAADAFCPTPWNGAIQRPLTPVRELILPDNTPAAGFPVYFEGRLQQFERHVGVVYVVLEAPPAPDQSAEGVVLFRGEHAVVVRGPALVRLAHPFRVEKLPPDASNYWQDLQIPRAHFVLPF